MSADVREPLILHRPGITDRVDELFKAMSIDAELRERFVKDPAQVLATYTEGVQLPPQEASATNQLVYAVLSNRPLLEWLQKYAQEHQGEPPSRRTFGVDFSRAVVDHGGDHAILKLIRNSATPRNSPGRADETFITSSSIFASGFAFPTDHQAEGLHQIQSFQHSSEFDHTGGPSTEGHPTEVRTRENSAAAGIYGSPYVRVTIDALVRHATELREAGVLGTTPVQGGSEHAD
ncbi:hypothetical protein ACT1U9_30050 [Streptomyces sp. BR1]|uniref:hypothetical protein n=1 Tax=Streptomyces sp. BR1 TaxID=1592323 RepID=UPI00402B706B